MEIKAIALDMDGTLLDPLGSIDDKLSTFLVELQKKGIKLFIATGRTQKEISDVLPEHIQVDGYVTANGMGAYTDNRKLAQFSLDEALLQEVIANAKKESIYYEVHPLEGSRFALAEDQDYFSTEIGQEIPKTLLNNEYNSRTAALQKEIQWVQKLTYDNIVKVYFFSMNPEKITKWKKELQAIQQDKAFTMFSSSLHNVEIMVSGVSKATGIELLLKEYELSKEHLLVVGDGENDIPMFRLAAHSVAMKNAEEIVKAEADEVTVYSYEQNGLYHYLSERFK